MTPLHRQSVATISAKLVIHVANLYNFRSIQRLQGEVMAASLKEPEGWDSILESFRKHVVSAAIHADMANVVGISSISGFGELIQTTSG